MDPTLPGVNSFMTYLPCRLPTIEHVMHMIEPGWVLGEHDLMLGFSHCVLDPEARKSMGFKHIVSGSWCVSVSQPPAEVCLTDLAWDYPGV